MNESIRPNAGPEILHGIAGSPGVAIGKVVVLGPSRLAYPRRRVSEDQVDHEIARFDVAVVDAQEAIRKVAVLVEPVEGHGDDSVLDAYVHMVGDPLLSGAVRRYIRNDQRCAEWAVAAAIDSISSRLSAVDDAYLRERSHDVEFVGERLLRALSGLAGEERIPALDGPSVIVAFDLSPADTAAMMGQPVVAFVTEMGTRTSHTAIMARALEIPAVVGVQQALSRVSGGDTIIVDGLRGDVIVRPDDQQILEAEQRGRRHVALSTSLHKSKDLPPATKDGVALSMKANVELPEEARLALQHGAQGIGLYRTEFLYINRAEPPTEEDQYQVYASVIAQMQGRPVTLRTFDIGGDKFASTFQVPPEMNPMLGLRAIRLALARPDVFKQQLRAMVRASAHGDLRIMVPMVSGLSELRQARALLLEAHQEVRERGLSSAPDIPLGVMIEVPSAAVLVDLFAKEAAFLSIGTNDLIQYSLAVDRTSRSMAYLASPFDPSIIRLIKGVVAAGQSAGCPVSICGAMASDPLAAVLLAGLGVRDFSMESAAIPEIKETLMRVDLTEAEAVAAEALGLSTAEEIEHCFAEAFAPRLYDILTGEDT